MNHFLLVHRICRDRVDATRAASPAITLTMTGQISARLPAEVTIDVARGNPAYAPDAFKADLKNRIQTLRDRNFTAEATPHAKTDDTAARVGLPVGGFALGALAGLLVGVPMAAFVLGGVIFAGTLHATEGIHRDLKRVRVRSEAEGLKGDAICAFNDHLQRAVEEAPMKSLPSLVSAAKAMLHEADLADDPVLRIRLMGSLKRFILEASRRRE